MVFGNGVKNIQAAAYNGASTVTIPAKPDCSHWSCRIEPLRDPHDINPIPPCKGTFYHRDSISIAFNFLNLGSQNSPRNQSPCRLGYSIGPKLFWMRLNYFGLDQERCAMWKSQGLLSSSYVVNFMIFLLVLHSFWIIM